MSEGTKLAEATSHDLDEFCNLEPVIGTRIHHLISSLREHFSDTDIEIKDVSLTYDSEGLHSVCVIWSTPECEYVMGRTITMKRDYGYAVEPPPKSMAELREYFYDRVAADSAACKVREEERQGKDGKAG